MSTNTASWLSRQRKTDLAEMAEAAGMQNFKNLKKAELELDIENHLRANQSSLQGIDRLSDFYKRIKDGSPVASGKELVKSESKTPSKPRRRTIVPKDDIVSESETPSDANTLRTPGRQSLGVASQIPLPPSPAVVAQEVERQTARFSAWANDVYLQTGLNKHVQWARDKASTSQAVTTVTVALEAFVLMSVLLPYKYLGIEIPAVPVAGVPAFPLRAPQFWNLLEVPFWATTFLWASTTVILPALAANMVNLASAKRHGSRAPKTNVDPFIFNIVKLFLTWLVFQQGLELPTFALNEARINIHLGYPGGYAWLYASGVLGALVSLYEAVLRH